MPFPRHALLTFGGTLGTVANPVDEWTCGIRFRYSHENAVDAVPSVAELTTYLNDTAVPALRAFWAKPGVAMNVAILRWAKFNAINTQGHYEHDTTVVADLNPAVAGASTSSPTGAPKYPYQVSSVMTFETAANRGWASKGRIFLPAPPHTLTVGGLFDPANIQAQVDHTAALLQDLTVDAAVQGVEFYPAVVSQKSNDGQGTMRDITAVSGDNRPDIQRSRAKSVRGTRVRNVLNA